MPSLLRLRVQLAALALAASPVVAPPSALAQSAPIDVDGFRPTFDGRGVFGVEGAGGHEFGEWGAGAFFHFARYLLRPESTNPRSLATLEVPNRLTMTLLGSVGLTRWLSVGLALPLALANTIADGTTSSNRAGLGSMWLLPKFRILREGPYPVALSVLAGLGFPSASDDAFLGSRVVFQPMAILEKAFGAWRALFNLGFRLHSAAPYNGLEMGSQLDLRLGAGWRVHDRVELGAEVLAATQLASPFMASKAGTAAELLVGARFFPGHRWQIYAGGGPGLARDVGAPSIRLFAGVVYAPHDPDADGDGVPDRYDRCPHERGPASNHGCPQALDERSRRKAQQGRAAFVDSDGDGVPDAEDACPRTPGPRENQGCPWTDRDGDGVLDKDDRCPDVAGPVENQGCPYKDTDADGVPDKDDDCPLQPGPKENRGCPVANVQLTRCELRIVKAVRFKSGSAALENGSQGILDEVAKVLVDYPTVRRVEVQGHTDDVGSAKANLALSKRRAESVAKYLARKGVDAERLVPKGYGAGAPLLPIDEDMSAAKKKAARARNRRVQFVILENSAGGCDRR